MLFRLRAPKQLTSTLCTYLPLLTTVLLESAKRETKVCGRTGYRTQDLWLFNQMRYQLHYMARLTDFLTFSASAGKEASQNKSYFYCSAVGSASDSRARGTGFHTWSSHIVSFLLPLLSRRAAVSHWQKYVHEVLVNCLGLSMPRKSVVR